MLILYLIFILILILWGINSRITHSCPFPLKTPYWYNTILAYSAGSFFAEHQERIIPLLRKYYWLLLAGVTSIFVVSYYFLPGVNGFSTNLAFALISAFTIVSFVIGLSSLSIHLSKVLFSFTGSSCGILFSPIAVPSSISTR